MFTSRLISDLIISDLLESEEQFALEVTITPDYDRIHVNPDQMREVLRQIQLKYEEENGEELSWQRAKQSLLYQISTSILEQLEGI